MKISLRMTLVITAIFATICFGVAITGFSSMGDITDPVQLSDSYGFAWFWTFLGSVALLFFVLSWWLLRTHKDGDA